MSSAKAHPTSVLVASTNRGKIREFEKILAPAIKVQSVGLPPFDTSPPKVLEDGDTYYENALKKALAFQKVYRVPVLTDDSGLEVDPLGGRPGVLSARYGGESASYFERWKLLAEALAPFPRPWLARFRCVLCYYDGQTVPYFFEGFCEGEILPSPRGDAGFGYDPIFYSPTLGKSFGEATDLEKRSLSHRAAAAREFLNWALD